MDTNENNAVILDEQTENYAQDSNPAKKNNRKKLYLFIGTIVLAAIIAIVVIIAPGDKESQSEGLFYNGFTQVRQDGLWGLINEKGDMVVDCKYEWVNDFTDSELILVVKDEKIGWIDTEGRVVIRCKYDGASYFSEGLAAVEEEGKWGCINEKGEYVIKPKFNNLFPFKNKVAVVEDSNNKDMLINTEGVVIAKYDWICDYQEENNFLAVCNEHKWGYIDNTGKEVIKPQYDHVYPFKEGLALVETDEKYGYINEKGEYVIKPQYTHADSFDRGVASVRVGDKYALIDKTGKYLLKPQYDDYIYCDEDKKMIAVNVDGKWGYVNLEGKEIIPPMYEKAEPFMDGSAVVKLDGKYGMIDTEGKFITDNEYYYMSGKYYDDGYCIAGLSNKKFTILDRLGRRVIQDEYEAIDICIFCQVQDCYNITDPHSNYCGKHSYYIVKKN